MNNEIRLNKYIANSGVCSRREADKYIKAGLISVNNIIITLIAEIIEVTLEDQKINDKN